MSASPEKRGADWSARMHAAKAAKRAAGAAASSSPATDARVVAASGSRAQLEAIAADRKTPPAVQVQALRTLLDLDSGPAAELPTSAAAVAAASTAQLHAWLHELDPAHPWPPQPEPAPAQA